MQITYDPRYNVGYLSFQEKKGEVETIRVSDELNIDLSPDGKLYGIELLNANEQLRGKGLEQLLIVINAATGERLEVPLAG
jgi:uncharacterized protein YuzE